jgi:hypothetical protein
MSIKMSIFDPCQRGPDIVTFYNHIDHALHLKIFSALKTFRQAFANGLFYSLNSA